MNTRMQICCLGCLWKKRIYTASEEPIFSITCAAEATRKDPVMSKVLSHTLHGWPAQNSDRDLQPYFNRHTELSVEGGVLLWGLRVMVPPAFRDGLLEELHEQHPGIYRMKAFARSYVWWPSIDTDTEGKVKTCQDCTRVCNTPPMAPLQPWSWPTQPWQRVHIDYAKYQGKYFFMAVDAHSKWPEIFTTTKSTTEKTITILRHIFSSYGFPEQIVNDSGPQFTSDQFADFLRQNGVRHTRSAPYHPATNGAAERMVQVLKKGLKLASWLSVDHQLANLLLSYQSTPHSTAGVPPAELFLKRQLRTHLILLKPDQEAAVCQKQEQQKQQHDQNSKQMCTTSPVPSPAASSQGRTSDTTLVPNPKAQPSRDGSCLMINKDVETTCKTWFVNVHWLTRSETVLQRTIITANWAIVGCMRSTMWNCIGCLGPLHSFMVMLPSLRGKEV